MFTKILGWLSIAVLAAVTSACSGTDVPTRETQRRTLTVAVKAAPMTLDPAKSRGQVYLWFNQLAYEPLIIQDSDGSFRPGLAESWKFVGEGNTTFKLALRQDAKFADGSPLTADAVVEHLEYVGGSTGQAAQLLVGDTFTATGPHEVTIKATTPNPDFEFTLSQNGYAGQIISPSGLAKPEALGNRTFGAGPYQLDTEATVASAEYTYTPNPHYHDPDAARWDKIVVKVIPNGQSLLQAMQTGQVDLALGESATVSAAKRAGLSVTDAPQIISAVTLADRAGSMAKPLGDVRVRRALNFATDRAAIAKGLFHGNPPAAQIGVPGGYAYDPELEKAYPYDVAKARELLSEAGYPDGFTLDLLTTEVGGFGLLAQSLGEQWKQIGVTLKVTNVPNPSAYMADTLSGKAPAFISNFIPQPLAVEGPNLFLPSATYNPLRYEDPVVVDLYRRAVAAEEGAATELHRRIKAHLVEQAWFVPVVAQSLPFYASDKITGVTVSPKSPYVSLYDVGPA